MKWCQVSSGGGAREKFLQFSEVFIIPQYSEIGSRSEVCVETTINHDGQGLTIDVPVMSANMSSVTDGRTALAMWKAGAIGALHRFMSVEENVREFKVCHDEGGLCFVSVGVAKPGLITSPNSVGEIEKIVPDAYERAERLYEAGARYFIIDIAHGHSWLMRDMIIWMRQKFELSVYIMAGNVATPGGIKDLARWGVDAAKIGAGPGSVCLTKNITGVTVPQFSAIEKCCDFPVKTRRGLPLVRVADGGIAEPGDIAKALGAGADLVMCGRMFAGCTEAPGTPAEGGQKVYFGMASKTAMLSIRPDDGTLPTPEGTSIVLDIDSPVSVAEVVKNIKGALQSSFSYSNALNLREFQRNVLFGTRT